MFKKFVFIYFFLVFNCQTWLLAQDGPTIQSLVGVNIKVQQENTSKASRFGYVRDFHLWDFDMPKWGGGEPCPFVGEITAKLRWNPSYNKNRLTRYDDFYGALAQKVLPVLHGNAPGMYGETSPLFAKPICPDAQVSNDLQATAPPYLPYSIWTSLFAARYGAPPTGGFPTNFTNIAGDYIASPDNISTKMGKGLIKYIEVFNEPDAAWKDGLDVNVVGDDLNDNPTTPTTFYMRPREYASMLSAAYDGNKKSDAFKMKRATGIIVPDKYWGIKNLSSNVQVVLGGTADFRSNYLQLLANKWDELRGVGDYPFDVFNFHFYSTKDHPKVDDDDWDKFLNGRKFFANGPYFDINANTNIDDNQGIFPESDNIQLKQRLSSVISNIPNAFSVAGQPSKPIWITEFGYDVSEGTSTSQSGINVGAVPGFDAQTIQGQWLTRYILEATTQKKIEKLFIYELADDFTDGNTQFATSGLTNPNGTPKKSWNHIMTMLSALGPTRFIEDNFMPKDEFQDANGTTQTGDDPRIYRYTASTNNKSVYALWMPHGANTKIENGSFRVRKTTVGDIKPTVQKIEVIDWDEDGKRTQINPTNIVDDGTFWKIKEITLTETPIYLRFNPSGTLGDPTINPVSNLDLTCLSCNNATLTWSVPTGSSYNWYQVYYAKKSSYGGSPSPFDPAKATLAIERLPGSFKSAIINGLTDGEEYYFWVIPFKSYGINNTVSPDFSGILVSGQHFLLKKFIGCASACTIPLNATNLEGGTNTPFWLAGNIARTLALSGNTSNICTELAGIPATVPNSYISVDPFGTTPFNSITFTINLGGTFYLDAINFFLRTGTGSMKIEILKDCCLNYELVANVNLFPGSTYDTGRWFNISNGTLNQQRVEKIRFTISSPLVSLEINRMYFCGRPATDLCKTSNDFEKNDIQQATEASVSDIDTRSANINWATAKQYAGTEKASNINFYVLKYGVALGAEGEILQPIETSYESQDWESDIKAPLSSLIPNTTYYVDITVNADAAPCVTYPPTGGGTPGTGIPRLTFTTLEEKVTSGGRNLEKDILKIESNISLFPNPVNDILSVNITQDKYQKWVMTNINGVVISEGFISNSVTTFEVNTSKIPSGSYIITFISENIRPVSKVFIVNRKE
jgi:hypothetical protein